jgi:hypothetical protein
LVVNRLITHWWVLLVAAVIALLGGAECARAGARSRRISRTTGCAGQR